MGYNYNNLEYLFTFKFKKIIKAILPLENKLVPNDY